MENSFKELADFRYQVNLWYVQSILKKEKIPFESEDDARFKLFVKAKDYPQALTIVENLHLDESVVDDDSDGYIDGYREWAEKQFVSGYFTGGTIPRWMYDKKYAMYFGPIFIITGLFYLITSVFDSDIFSFGISGLISFLIFLIYIVCGILLSIKGFKTKPRSAPDN